MRHIIPDYYNQFEYVGKKCVNTCCKYWDIDVDEEAYEKYSKLKGKLGEKIYNSVSEDKKFILQHGKCVLLEQDGLCSIHKAYGENYLTNVCRQYPRTSHQYYDLYEEFVGLSCPEVVRLLIGHKDKIYFCQDEIEVCKKTSNFLEADSLYFEMMEELRSLLIDLVQLDDFPLWKRLFLLIDVCKQFDSFLSAKEHIQYKTLLSKYKDKGFLELYAKQLDSIPINLDGKVGFYKNIILILMEHIHVFNKDFYNQFQQVYNILFYEKDKFNKSVIQDMDENIEFNKIWKELSYFRENFCVYSIFNNFFSCMDTKDIWKENTYIIIGLSFIKLFLYVDWKANGNTLDEDHICFIISAYARVFEHGFAIRDALYCSLKESGVICQAYLVMLLDR